MDKKHEPIRTSNTNAKVYTNLDYPSDEREVWPKWNGIRNQAKHTILSNKPLSEFQPRRNLHVAKTCACMGHVFATIEGMGGKIIRTIDDAQANFAMKMIATWHRCIKMSSSPAHPDFLTL